MYDLNEIKNIKGDKSQNDALLGVKFLFDPETYVDSGFSLAKHFPTLSQGQHVKIWSHINAKVSKDLYYVYQNLHWVPDK